MGKHYDKWTQETANKIAKKRNHRLEKSNTTNGWWVIHKNDNRPEYYDRLSDYVQDYIETTKF